MTFKDNLVLDVELSMQLAALYQFLIQRRKIKSKQDLYRRLLKLGIEKWKEDNPDIMNEINKEIAANG